MRETPSKKPPRELFVRDLVVPASPHPGCGPGQVTTMMVGEEKDSEPPR